MTKVAHSKGYTQISVSIMDAIHNENDYQEVMTRIDKLFFETDEDTPINDPRLVELDRLVSLVETYEKQYSA